MLYIVLFFLAFSFFLYVLLGGADFGAGILELFSSKENKKLIKKTVYSVMGPVWEANHIWIIILIVILWIAFPGYYNILVIYLHIPLTLVLLGITLRGVAFVFRHYDAVKDKSQILYDKMFELSCVVTPIFLGMTFGTLISGNIVLMDTAENPDFVTLFIAPWFQAFPIAIGLFFAALCTFLAATFLIGEVDLENRKLYIRKATIATYTVIVLGLITLVIGYSQEKQFVLDFIQNYYALGLVSISAILIFPLWYSIRKGDYILCRFFAGLQVILIITAALFAHYPDIIITKTGAISLLDNAAPPEVIKVLAISLLVGGFLILPGLFHLLKSFKMIKILETTTAPDHDH